VQWQNTEHKKKRSHAGGANLMTRSVSLHEESLITSNTPIERDFEKKLKKLYVSAKI